MKNKVKRLYDLAYGFSVEMQEDHVRAFASSAAFFVFLSLIPYIILVLAIIPYTPLTKADVLAAVVGALPNALDGYAIMIIDQLYANTFAALSFSIIAVVWSSAQGFLSITNGLNTIFEVHEKRNYFVMRARAGLYTVVLAVIMVASLMLSGFGRTLRNFAEQKLIHLPVSFQIILDFRILLTWAVLTLMFTLIYTTLPYKKQQFRYQIPGALFTSIVWTLYSWAFSLYISNFNAFSMYGSLATVVIVMLWLYMCMYIMFVGAQLNDYFKGSWKKFFDKRKKQRS